MVMLQHDQQEEQVPRSNRAITLTTTTNTTEDVDNTEVSGDLDVYQYLDRIKSKTMGVNLAAAAILIACVFRFMTSDNNLLFGLGLFCLIMVFLSPDWLKSSNEEIRRKFGIKTERLYHLPLTDAEIAEIRAKILAERAAKKEADARVKRRDLGTVLVRASDETSAPAPGLLLAASTSPDPDQPDTLLRPDPDVFQK